MKTNAHVRMARFREIPQDARHWSFASIHHKHLPTREPVLFCQDKSCKSPEIRLAHFHANLLGRRMRLSFSSSLLRLLFRAHCAERGISPWQMRQRFSCSLRQGGNGCLHISHGNAVLFAVRLCIGDDIGQIRFRWILCYHHVVCGPEETHCYVQNRA